MTNWQAIVQEPAVQATVVLIVGLVVGYLVGKLNERVLRAAGVPEMVEGTPFERTARSLGTSTVSLLTRLTSWFVYGVAILTAIHVARLLDADLFWERLTGFVPDLFIAILVFIVGFVVADKAELLAGERLRGVKLPEVTVIPKIVKYSVLYVTMLVALDQLGVNLIALLILLAAYLFALVIVGTVAFKPFLVSGTVGLYLLLNQPYGIGDRIRVGDREGVVQEVDVFVTRIESDGEEHIVPNDEVFAQGVSRERE